MRSSDEIKKGLECCIPKWDGKSVVPRCGECPYIHEGRWCRTILFNELRRYIFDIEQRLAQAERERDAAVRDISEASYFQCCVCKHGDWPNCKKGRNNVVEDDICKCELFEWRGVCEENSK